MHSHPNARLTQRGRHRLVIQHLEQGRSVAELAAENGISLRCAYRWLARYRSGGVASLADRRSARRTQRRTLDPQQQQQAVDLRHQRLHLRYIARLLAAPFSTVARALNRVGLGRLRNLEPKPPVQRYEWERPGDLLHIDVKTLARFRKVGHRITGDRKKGRSYGVGYDKVHVAIDDATRLAYVEVLEDEQKPTVIGFLTRALAWFNGQGIECRRVMSDNGPAYVSNAFAKACRTLGLRHIRTRPYTPRTNGKAERFIQTLCREWAYSMPFQNSHERNRRLPRYLTIYNRLRKHSSLGWRSPQQRLRELLG
jgi:transposase InsO family protein